MVFFCHSADQERIGCFLVNGLCGKCGGQGHANDDDQSFGHVVTAFGTKIGNIADKMQRPDPAEKA